jgi:hypothetical protein
MALVGAAIGWELPTHRASAVTLALLLGAFGALMAARLPRLRDWEVALLAPLLGAVTGAAIGAILDGVDAAAMGVTAGVGFGLMALPPLVLMTDAARRAGRSSRGSSSAGAMRRRIWLLALAMTAMAAVTVPALSRALPSLGRSRLAELGLLGMMALACIDAVALTRLLVLRAPTPALPHPYRELDPPATPPARERERLILGECLTIDSLLLIAVGSALLLAR